MLKQLNSSQQSSSSKNINLNAMPCPEPEDVEETMESYTHEFDDKFYIENCLLPEFAPNVFQKGKSNEKHKCEMDKCDKIFKYKSELRKHQLDIHPLKCENINWLECPFNGCQFRTKLKSRLNAHENIHSKVFVCEICEKAFSCKGHLKRHRSIHNKTTQRIKPDFICNWPGCERLFKHNYKLKIHMNIHTAEKLFKCCWPDCDKALINKQSLSTHMSRHRKLDYLCESDECHYQTTNPDRFRNHMKWHSKNANL